MGAGHYQDYLSSPEGGGWGLEDFGSFMINCT